MNLSRAIDRIRRQGFLCLPSLLGLLKAALIVGLSLFAISAIGRNLAALPLAASGDSSISSPERSDSLNHHRQISVAYCLAQIQGDRLFGVQKVAERRDIAESRTVKSLEQLLASYEIKGAVLGDMAKAIIEERETGELRSIGVGERLDQIEIVEITQEYITFQLLGDTVHVRY